MIFIIFDFVFSGAFFFLIASVFRGALSALRRYLGEDVECSMGGFGGSTVILNICLICRSDAEVSLVNMEQDLSNVPFNMCACCKLWAYGIYLDFCYLLNKVNFSHFCWFMINNTMKIKYLCSCLLCCGMFRNKNLGTLKQHANTHAHTHTSSLSHSHLLLLNFSHHKTFYNKKYWTCIPLHPAVPKKRLTLLVWRTKSRTPPAGIKQQKLFSLMLVLTYIYIHTRRGKNIRLHIFNDIAVAAAE